MANVNDYRDYLQHSQGPWKNHKYIGTVISKNGKKWYKYAKGAYDRSKYAIGKAYGNAKKTVGKYATLADKYADKVRGQAMSTYKSAKNAVKSTVKANKPKVESSLKKTVKKAKNAADTISKNASKKVSEIKKNTKTAAKKVANDVSWAVNKKSNDKKMAETRKKVNAQNQKTAGLTKFDKESGRIEFSKQYQDAASKINDMLNDLPDNVHDKLFSKYEDRLSKLEEEWDRAWYDIEGTDRVEYSSVANGVTSQMNKLLGELGSDVRKEQAALLKKRKINTQQ